MITFQLGNISFDGSFPNGIPLGEYLLPFIQTEQKPFAYRVSMSAVQAPIEVPSCAVDTGDYYYDADSGIIVSRYAFLRKAASFHPADWKNDDFHFVMDPNLPTQPGFSLNQLLGMLGIHCALLYRSALVIHASYILVNGEAILFLGPSGTGKSTQAALWEKYAGAEIINGDRALLYLEGERLYAGGFPVCGSSDICKNVSAPVRAIVVLRKEKENYVRPMRLSQAYAALLAGVNFYHWSADENRLAGDLIMRVLESTEVVQFGCLPDRTAVEELQRYLYEL